jgi:hypothetical protein
MVMSVRTWRARAAAITVVLLGLTYLVQVPRLTDVAAYLGLLVGAGVAVAFFAGTRLWSGGHMDGRILALCLSVCGLVAHLLNALHGLPGASPMAEQVSSASVLSIGLELVTVVLLAADAARRPAPIARRHPYAL